MKASNLLFVLMALTCGLLLPQQARAGSTITGATSITYDADSNIVTGTTMTELDYASQDWYQSVVSGSIKDSNNNVLASSGVLHDIDRDGTVSATVEVTGTDQMEYTMTGSHIALADIQDYVSRGTYIDYWGFQKVYNGEDYYYIYMPFFAPGPGGSIRNRTISLGKTYANAQAKPRLGIESTTFSASSVARTGGSTNLTTSISATPGTKPGDQIVVEVTHITGDSTFTYSGIQVSGQTATTTLAPGDKVNVTFTITTASDNQGTGNNTFRVRIYDILRPNGQGGLTSVYNNNYYTGVSADGATTSVLKVNP